MRTLGTAAFALASVWLTATSSYAQQPPLPSTPIVLAPVRLAAPAQLSSDQEEELARWLDAMIDWQRQEKRWHNEPAHNAYGKIVPRKPRPATPEWLESFCRSVPPHPLTPPPANVDHACRIIAGMNVDIEAERIRQQTQTARASHEKVTHTSFLSRLHLDGLWSTTSSDVRYYGLIGSHISLVDVGRVQFFGPPGILVLRMPDASGSHQIRVGYTWGMSVRLADVRLFGPTKNMTLFLSIAKCWTFGNTVDRLNPGGFDIAGFSIAPRKPRR